jgi:hypothetical protein
MRLFKRKKEKKKKDSTILFKKGSSKRKHKKRTGLKSFFKSKSKKKKPKKRKNLKRTKKLLSVAGAGILAVFVLSLVGVLIYFGIQNVIEIRKDAGQSIKGVQIASENVIGFKSIPIYPNSKFIYKDYMDEPTVKEFINGGEAVYRLPINTSFSEVQEYYQVALEEDGWEKVLSAPVNSSKYMYGDYWVNKEEKEAVRIYNKLNDIWYEKITISEAQNGLQRRVEERNERNLIVSSTDGTELLPDYPWSLKVPNEYLVQYYSTDFDELKGVKFRKIGTDEVVFVEPIGKVSDTTSDVALKEFLKNNDNGNEGEDSVDEESDQPTTETEWKLTSSSFREINGKNVFIGTIDSNNNSSAKAFVIKNPKNSYYYLVTAYEVENQLVDYVLKNIVSKRTGYDRDAFEF